MDNRLVSIVIPCFNREKYLAATLESCLNQTYPNIEVIIVDDGSVDGSLNIARKYAANDRRIKILNITHQGPCAARNVGLEASNGKFIKFLDSDDLLLPYSIEYQVRSLVFFQSEMTAANALGFRDTELSKTRERLPRELPFSGEGVIAEDILDFIKHGVRSPGDILFSRRIIQEIGGFEPKLKAAEEINLWLRIAMDFPEIRVFYHKDPKLLLKRVGHDSQAARHRNVKWVLSSIQCAAETYLEKSPRNKKLKKYIFDRLYTAMAYSYRNGLKSEALAALEVWKKAGLKTPILQPWYHDTLHRIFDFLSAEQILATFRKIKYQKNGP
ncbi:MAG: glycosyltransferase family A protein [Candidatus Omnitrophota bacterium]